MAGEEDSADGIAKPLTSEAYYVQFWTGVARDDAKRCLQLRATSCPPQTTAEGEVEDQELLSYEHLFGFLVRRSRADRRAGEETIAKAELLLSDLLARLLRGEVPKFVKRAAEREKKNKGKKKLGRPQSLTPLQRHQIESVDALVTLAGDGVIPRFGVEAAALEALDITEFQFSHYRRSIVRNSLIDFMREYALLLNDNGNREAWARDIISDAGDLFRSAAHDA
jgi:hypothetical protein